MWSNLAYFMANEEALHVEMALVTDSSQPKAQFNGTIEIAYTDEELLTKQNMQLWYQMHAIPVMQGLDPIQ